MKVGDVFANRFEVLRVISTAGAQGFVYEVLDRTSGWRRALKTLAPHVASSGRGDEFRREIQASAEVPSGHVVEVIDAGVDVASKRPWLLMELLEGETLRERGQRGPMDVAEFTEVFSQLGHAMMAAHGKGVLHLDLKPSNVFLARPRREGAKVTLKVLDFGIARRVAKGLSHVNVSKAMGTPEWMAPEQTGTGALRPSADVWAIGLLAFHAFTGKEFWRAQNHASGQKNPMAVWEEVITSSTVGMVPASIRARELGVAVEFPPGFDAWFARCVAYEQDQRYRDANEAIPALRECFRAVAPAAPVAPVVPVVLKRGRTRWIIAAVALALVGVTFGALELWASLSDISPSVRRQNPEVPVLARGCPPGALRVPGGDFSMGAPDGRGYDNERPVHPVSVSPFCMDRTEVTVRAYRGCVEAGRCSANVTASTANPPHDRAPCTWGQPNTADHPITCVDWNSAVSYCSFVGGRLPTEAEWEFAARGPDGRVYPWGSMEMGSARVNLCGPECARWAMSLGLPYPAEPTSPGDNWPSTSAVGIRPAGASPYGILDMAGNVCEWTADRYGPYPPANSPRVVDPRGPEQGLQRSFRGGGWAHGAEFVTTFSRGWFAPEQRMQAHGFRCAYGTSRL